MAQGETISLTAHDVYMREVRWISQLTEDEEACLLHCLASGKDVERVRARLTEGYQPLIISLARQFVRHCRHLELLDLIQEGGEGFLQALNNYQADKDGAFFRVFALAWVRGKMLLAVWQNERFIRLPFDKIRAIRQMTTVTTQLLTELGREPSLPEVAQAMGLKERDVWELIVLQEQEVMSLQAFPTNDGDLALEEVIADPATAAFTPDRFSLYQPAL